MAKPQSSRSPAQLAEAIQEAIEFHRAGQFAEAEKRYARVLKSYPGQFDALHLLGVVKQQRGKLGEAYQLITSALKVNPRSPDALANLAMVLHGLKRDEEALGALDKALSVAPDHIEALNNRGNALLALTRSREAVSCFDRVLSLAPRHVEARVNRGSALAALARFEDAIAAYDAALAIHPRHAGAHFNRGHALHAVGRHGEAIAAFDDALALSPGHVGARINRGLALQALNRLDDALASYRAAIAIEPASADAHFNEALALLTLGDLRAGFEKYEWRWKRTDGHRRSLGKPLWLGEYPLARKTILLHAEQGLGDTIQFVRYAPLIARMGATVILEVQPELTDLLAQVEGVSQVVGRGEALPAFDVHCPLASLPLALRTEPATIPAAIPYLAAAESGLAKWRPRIENLAAPRVAIAWSGRATHANDRNRSIPLDRLAPLFSHAPARFVSVQRDLRDGDAAALRDLSIAHVGDDLASFTDTASVLALSDLVIAVDTSVAHLAAAMGRPTWILLPFAPDWRWTLQGERSPWYPSARLFRQPSPGDWDSVIASVRSELDRGINAASQ